MMRSKIMWNLSVLLCFLSASLCLSQAHGSNGELLCQRARQAIEGICEDVSTGAGSLTGRRIGKMGPRGIKGDRGEPGVVDYERIFQKVGEMYLPEINILMIKDNDTMAMIEKLNESVAILKEENTKKDQEISILRSTLEELESTVQNQADNLTSLPDELQRTRQAQEFCKVYYGGKCFWYVHERCTYSEAEAICAEVPGGRPAVVYSAIHYEQLGTYIRSLIDYTYFWLGLKINPSTKEVTIISEGTPAPFLKWHPAYPKSGSGYTSVTLQLYKDPSNRGSGMFNNRGPTSRTDGVLCEA